MTIARVMVVGSVVLLLAGLSLAEARSHLTGRRDGAGEPPEGAEPRMVISPSGVTPLFPREAVCPEIASPFGSRTRYDGSPRPLDRFGGLHGGIDVSLPEGTPLLAIAAGKVVSVGTAGMFTGIYVWLQHAPADTGLAFWVYSKYQHLRDLPELRVGDTVRLGEVVGRSGKTGTTGRHYGMSGYPHLHLTTFAGPSDRYEVRDASVLAAMSRIVDPVVLYARGIRDLDDLDLLSRERRSVAIPYVAADGARQPVDARLVWPVACGRR